MSSKKQIGDILVERKLIREEDITDALEAQRGTQLRLGQILVKKGLVSENDILAALAEHYGIPYIPGIQFEKNDEIFKKIPVYFLKKNRLAPFKIEANVVSVAILDPLNILPFDDLKMMFPSMVF